MPTNRIQLTSLHAAFAGGFSCSAMPLCKVKEIAPGWVDQGSGTNSKLPTIYQSAENSKGSAAGIGQALNQKDKSAVRYHE